MTESDNEQHILEDVIVKTPPKLFSKISFSIAVLCVFLIVFVLLDSLGGGRPSQIEIAIFDWLGYGIIFGSFAGSVCSILSFSRHEKLRFFKIAGAIVNIILTLFFIGTFIYTRFNP